MAMNPITNPQAAWNPQSKIQDTQAGKMQGMKQQENSEDLKPHSGALQGDKQVDAYEKSEGKSTSLMPGIYRVSEDENGNPKILFHAPDKKSGGSNAPKEAPETTQCTMNTDKVDAEIAKLKEEKQKIQQQVTQAAGDEKKQAELEKRLAQLDAELLAKDNDIYRKQNAAQITGNVE